MENKTITRLVILLAVVFGAVSAGYAETAGIAEAPGDMAFSESGLLGFIGIFLIGLALNLTPCVYPMIAITVSILGGKQEASSSRAFFRALVYVMGMASMYSLLGVTAALTGGLFGGILQSQAMLAIIGVIFLVLSLSMFGLYELQPPAWLLNKLGNRSGAGYLGLFVSGLFVGIFAAPCVGPPVIGLLTLVAHSGDPLYGFAVFFVLSCGLGLPYVVLGTFSGLIGKLPRSGAWMLWVKKLMGVALVATGFFYLSLAVNPAAIFVLIPLTLLLGGFYLGFLDPSDGSALFVMFRRLVGLALVVAAVFGFMLGHRQSISWRSFSSEALAESQGQPRILYFSASWCIPCLELDRTTFADPSVIRKMSELSAYKIDLSSYDSPQSVELRKQYEIIGVPTIVFLDASGREIRSERVVGLVDVSGMMKKLELLSMKVTAEEAVSVSEDSSEEPNSRASLMADVEHVVPGMSFRIGVLFELKPEWYVYWLNPGDSGTEPQLEWTIPDGFSAGPVQWPSPQRFDAPPFATYGHSDRLMLFREITASSDLLPGDKYVFSVDASWLVCKDHCVGYDESLTLEMEVQSQESELEVYARGFFEEAADKLPRPIADWKYKASISDSSAELEIIPPADVSENIWQSLEIFPYQTGFIRAGTARKITANGSIVVVMQRTGVRPDSTFKAVMVLPEEYGEERFFHFETEWHEK